MNQSGLRIGFIGLGERGAPMAMQIAQAGFHLVVYARRAVALQPFVGKAEIATSAPLLGARCDLVCICVIDDAGIEDVLISQGLLAAMRPGSAIAIHTTCSPSICRAMADCAQARDVFVLDAPVSSTHLWGDRSIRLNSLMVGGDAGAVARFRPVLETMGRVMHLGPVGAGQRTKIINNGLYVIGLVLGHEAVTLAGLTGLESSAAADCFLHGSGASQGLHTISIVGTLGGLGRHKLTVVEKDLRLFLDLIDQFSAGRETMLHVAARAARDGIAAALRGEKGPLVDDWDPRGVARKG